MTDGEAAQLQADLRDIRARRAVLKQQYRGEIEAPPEYFQRLAALDDEEREVRAQLAPPPLPDTIRDQVRASAAAINLLDLELRGFREERREQDTIEAAERLARQRWVDLQMLAVGVVIALQWVAIAVIAAKVFGL